MVWSRVGTSVPSTISTVPLSKDLCGRSAIIGGGGRAVGHGSRLGKGRWVVERAFAQLCVRGFVLSEM